MLRFISFALLFLLAFCRMSAQTDSTTSNFDRPRFPGGERAFSAFWTENFQIPKKYLFNVPKEEGLVRFDVSSSGKISNARIVKSLNQDLDKSALNAVRNMPDWIPAYRDGKAVDAYIEIPFFVLFVFDANKPITQERRDSITRNSGWMMTLWGGPMICTGDYGTYFKPLRATIGIGYAYRKNNWMFGLEYDVFSFSKVQKEFTLNNRYITKENRLNPIQMYIPIGYWFENPAKKWSFCPFIAPTINLYRIEYKDLNPDRTNWSAETSENFWSVSAGLRVEKKVTIREIYNVTRQKMRCETTYVGARLMVNALNLNKSDATPMRGAAITLALNVSGWIQRGKKKAVTN
jgi:protein TonB